MKHLMRVIYCSNCSAKYNPESDKTHCDECHGPLTRMIVDKPKWPLEPPACDCED